MQPKPTRLLVAADVFGVTPELGRFVRALGADATLVSPHPFTTTYRSEPEAYAAFLQGGGVEAYARQLGRLMARRSGPFECALGFSAGASALWLCLADARLEPKLPHFAVLYYGSRIREHARLQPRRRMQVVFAEREASFDPAPLAAQLRAMGTYARVLPGTAHGFLNPLSPGFDAAVRDAEVIRLRDLLAD